MILPLRVLLICGFILGAASSWAGGKKEVARVSFHVETEATDNPKMIFPHQVFGAQRFFRRVPEVSSKDFASYTPFPADDQMSYGAVFRLKGPGLRRLSAVTSANIGRWLVCQAFGRVVDGVLIDGPVNDGTVVVWRGFSLQEITELDKSIDRTEEN